MRIRVVKPDYWHDRLLASFRPEVREFYIGLWMEADDTGWLRWQPEEIAADLYPYRGIATRERQVRAWLDQLIEAKRVILHPCGHAVIPTFGVHQRLGGNRITRVRDQHLSCQSIQVQTSTDESVRKVREGKGREGKVREDSHLAIIDGEWVAKG